MYIALATEIPLQHLTPDTAFANSALGYVLTQTVGALRDGADVALVKPRVMQWLEARQSDVLKQIEHGKPPAL